MVRDSQRLRSAEALSRFVSGASIAGAASAAVADSTSSSSSNGIELMFP
jgi:hypothetical protein